MNIIKVDTISSTNSYLRDLSSKFPLDDFTTLSTNYQDSGKGQLGTVWQSEYGKNLLFSIFKSYSSNDISNVFDISIITSLLVVEALESVGVPDLNIKWPNDILSCDKKICGILIENQFQGLKLNSSVIGVGLNVNQINFGDLIHVSSIKKITSKDYDRNDLLEMIIKVFESKFEDYLKKNTDELHHLYFSKLYLYQKKHSYLLNNSSVIEATNLGVTQSGKLKLLLHNNQINVFDVKEIKLVY